MPMLRGRHSNAFYRTSASGRQRQKIDEIFRSCLTQSLFILSICRAIHYKIQYKKERKNYSSKNRFFDQVRYIILSRKNIRKINLHIYYIFLSILRLKLQSALEVLLRSNSYVEDTKLVSCFIFRIFPFNLDQTFRYL